MTDTLLWSIKETARQLGGVSQRTVRRMVDAGELPVIKVRGARGIPAQAVRDWVARQIDVVDNQPRVGSGVRRQEINVCRINAKTVPSGGRRTPTQAAKELEDLLERRTKRKQKH